MQIVENRALWLKLRNPKRITDVIPKSKIIGESNGVSDVLIHWGLDEAQVLKNLGIKGVQSPIIGKYNWPGMYKPFAHQRVTADFLTLHRRSYCFNEQGCVDSDTEYLSPTGWKKISEYTGGKVAQYHPKTQTAEFVEPKGYVKLPCKGMIRIKTKYGLDQLLSPEHRVLLQGYGALLVGSVKTEVVSAQELYEREQAYFAGERAAKGGTRLGTKSISFSQSVIPTTFLTDVASTIILTDAELRLQVAVIADGRFANNTNRCVVRLKKERKIIRMRELLCNAYVEYKEREDRSITGEGFTVFTFNAPRQDKVFNQYYWGASASQLLTITDEVLYWDSCITRGERFSTMVLESANFIQYAFCATGRTARLLTFDRAEKGIEYCVQIRDNKALHIRGSSPNISLEDSTDGYKYCFEVPSTFLIFRRNGCVFCSGNTGKTMSVAWACDYLITTGKVKRVLVICPLSIMQSAWQADLFKTLMHRTSTVAHGTREKRIKAIDSGAEFVIINFDGVESVAKELKQGGFDLVVVDEANALKNHKTKRWAAINSLLKPDTWLWMLTGTPASQEPTDAYGLARMLRPDSVPRFFGTFKERVMLKLTQFKWVPKMNAIEEVNKVLQPAIRFTKEECLDLPEIVYTQRQVEMSPQQRKYYEILRKQFLMETSGVTITAANAAVNINKLLQISSGAVYTDDKEVVEFDVSPRYNVLIEAIEESSHKILVFIPFRHAIEVVRDKLTADGYTVDVIHGGVSPGQRNEIFQAFQNTPNPRVLLIQPAAASHGVTLHAANTIVWWGPVNSAETWLQANARVHRAGQKNRCTVISLCGSKVEQTLYKRLEKREDDQGTLLSMYKEALE